MPLLGYLRTILYYVTLDNIRLHYTILRFIKVKVCVHCIVHIAYRPVNESNDMYLGAFSLNVLHLCKYNFS